MVTLASLFDGIGGAPLCASMCGAEPVWASEIEKFPIMVTDTRFPNMKQLGDITKISGAEVEPVDIIVGGSPCQDLSVAGLRKGMKHSDFGDDEATRSGLFMEQIRIVKEMRSATNGSFPRFMVWENVPGAFSSNDGEDFRAVLEETARIADPTVWIPRPQDGWSNAGSVLGDGFSISWRTFDAQYWGVPQRRRRIYLVADFRGQSAPKILFERDGLQGDIAESGSEGKRAAGDVENGVRSAGFIGKLSEQTRSIGYAEETAPTLDSSAANVVTCFEPGAMTREMGNRIWSEMCPTLRADMGDNQPCICLNDQGGSIMDVSEKAATLRAEQHGHQPVVYESHPMDSRITGPVDVCPTVTNHFHKGSCDTPLVCFEPRSQDGVPRVSSDGLCPTINTAQGGQRQPCIATYQQVSGPLMANTHPGSYTGQDAYSDMLVASKTVRRLTPLECERLQGYPDGWTDIPGASDSARYKALGNSFAIPNALFVIQGCVEEVEREGSCDQH